MQQQPVPISNDQMFKRVFGSEPELCRRLIELALDEPISSIEYVEPQSESKDLTRPGGTYFDVLATTTSGELIDVEMQTRQEGGLPQRARLYLGRLSKEAWTRHVEAKHDYDFSKLPRVAVIFVCNFDPFDAGLRRYTWRMRCDQTNDAGDGSAVVYLNARGSGDVVSQDLAAFLSYAAGSQIAPGQSAFVDEVTRKVRGVNEDPEFLEGLMNLDEKLWWSKQEGREEGLEEGAKKRQKQIAELASRMAVDGRQDEFFSVLADPKLLDAELRRYGIVGES